jgi:DNA-binding beta-propeller fold protein YncE
MVLGRINTAAEADWLFNRPADVAFDKEGSIYVADGYGNSRVVKFDHEGRFLKSWGKYGSGPGEFILPHSIVIDDDGWVYVGDRENMRIQIFDTEGKYITEWRDIGYPYGLLLGEDRHIWMADGGFDRIVELDHNGKIVGALGRPGHGPGQFAWAHFMAMTQDRKIIVADVLNWRFQVFTPAHSSGELSTYIPERRMFWGSIPSSGWYYKQTDIPMK